MYCGLASLAFVTAASFILAVVTALVPIVPVPWVIVKSPARVVERLPIVPVVLLNVVVWLSSTCGWLYGVR